MPRSTGWPSSSATPGSKNSSRTPGPIPEKPTAHDGPRCKGLVGWKVKDADALLTAALKISADHHSIAATALGSCSRRPDRRPASWPRFTASTASRQHCGPRRIEKFAALAKDDPPLQEILITLVGDPDQHVRYQTWGAVRALKLTQAYPALKTQLALETSGFSGFAHRMLQETLEALQVKDPKVADTRPVAPAQTIAELERQAADLELKTKELRNRISALKRTSEQGGQSTHGTAATATSSTSH